MTTDERLDAIERRLQAMSANIDLCVNYVRELARAQLSTERIREIESELGSEHDGA